VSDNPTGGWDAIDAIRRQIDEIDRRLLDLLNERARRVAEVGEIKKQAGGMPLHQPEREREILETLESANRGPLSNQAIRRLFARILTESRTVEREVMGSTAGGPDGPADEDER
jgi:chorismate mutase-like protein